MKIKKTNIHPVVIIQRYLHFCQSVSPDCTIINAYAIYGNAVTYYVISKEYVSVLKYGYTYQSIDFHKYRLRPQSSFVKAVSMRASTIAFVGTNFIVSDDSFAYQKMIYYVATDEK